MYIIIFEDGVIRQIENIDESCLAGFEDGLVDLIDPAEMKVLDSVSDGNLMWGDIEQI